MIAGKIVSVIAAVADNGVIGANGTLPWNAPDDLKWFKNMTLGKTIIVGRKTFDTLPALPGREVFVLTREAQLFRNQHFQPVKLFDDLKDAIAHAGNKEVFIAGGGMVYKEVIESKMYDRLYIGRIRGYYDGDTVFPSLRLGAYNG